MIPEYSFWGIFTTEGRLQNQWVKALRETNPRHRLNRLRDVQERLHQDPIKFGHLWMPFLDSFLNRNNVSLVTDSDLIKLENMGTSLLKRSSMHLQSHEIWFRIVKAYDARNQKLQANALLRRSYRALSSNSSISKTICHNLAQRSAKADDDLSVYVHFLNSLRDHTQETRILTLLTEICDVNFDSDKASLKRAAELASQLEKSNIRISGIQTSLGLYQLQLKHNPSRAVNHFQLAIKQQQNETLALTGLASALIKMGEHSRVEEISGKILKTADSDTSDLITLNKTLMWLNSGEITGPPPATTAELNKSALRKYVGEIVDIALGKLHLLEGNAKKAEELLLPLVEECPDQFGLIYYTTWAATLTGSSNTLNSLLPALKNWSAQWTAALLIVDFDPTYAAKHDIYKYLKSNSTTYDDIIKTHLAIAETDNPPVIHWAPGNGSMEEELEALRTSLGYCYYQQDKSGIKTLLAMPLFQRLPLAEQVMWQGLQSLLLGDKIEGQTLLKKSVVQYGNKRAAFLLAVHLMEHTQISEADHYLNLVEAVRKDGKTQLLRAYINACNGNTNKAIDQLEKNMDQYESRARYGLGNIYLFRAEEARQAGNNDKIRLYREQAASAFSAAMSAENQTAPGDCEVLAGCAAILAQPDQEIEFIVDLWRQVNQLQVSRKHHWIVWNAIVALLSHSPAGEVAAACEEICSLLDDVENMSESVLLVIAQAAALACMNASPKDHADNFMKFLSHLASTWSYPSIRQLHQLSLTATLRARYANADDENKNKILKNITPLVQKDHANVSLALFLVQALLEHQKKSDALPILENAQPESHADKQLCGSILQLVQGSVPSSEDVPPFSSDLASELALAFNLLHGVALFAEDKPDKGYEALLAAMQIQADRLAQILNVENFLPSLCAYARKERVVPTCLVEGVRKMDCAEGTDNKVLTVARCAAAIGETEHACYLWDKLLKKNKESEHPVRQEFLELLCYLSVQEYKSNKHLDAAALLQKAAMYAVVKGD